MMFEFELEEVERDLPQGAKAGMALKFKALEEIRPVLEARGGIELEDVLWIFKRPQDALIAVMEMK